MWCAIIHLKINCGDNRIVFEETKAMNNRYFEPSSTLLFIFLTSLLFIFRLLVALMNYTSQGPCSVPPTLEARLVLLNQQNVTEVILFQCQARVLRRRNSSCFGGLRTLRCNVKCRAPCEKAI